VFYKTFYECCCIRACVFIDTCVLMEVCVCPIHGLHRVYVEYDRSVRVCVYVRYTKSLG